MRRVVSHEQRGQCLFMRVSAREQEGRGKEQVGIRLSLLRCGERRGRGRSGVSGARQERRTKKEFQGRRIEE